MPDPDAPPRQPIVLAQEPVRALGDLQLAPALLQLTGPAGVSSVEPLVMRLLLLLSAQPDMVLARETLIAQLWPKTVVGEDSLHRAIGQARRALAGCGSAASIVTVPRIGYRLCLDAQQDPAPSAVAVADGAAAADPARRRWLVGAVLAGAAGLGGLALWSQRAATPQRPPMVSALLTNSLAQRRLAEPDAERQGVELLREAVKHAPDDAELWGQLALALRAVAEYAPPPRVAAALSEVEVAARRALALDRGQADARAALVMLQPLHGNWLAAERGFTAILADAPDHLPSLDGLSQVQASAGLLALHYPSRLRTVALDPLHAGYNFRAIYAHWMNGHIAAADRAGARGLELWPRHAATWNARFGLFGMTGRAERALAMLADEASRPRLPPPYLAMLKTVAGALAGGDGKDRDGAVDRVTAVLAGGGPFMAVMGSMWLAALGAPDRSLQVIEAFLLERGPMMVEPNWRPGQFLHNDVRRRFTNFLFTPVMAPVQALPDFDAVTEAIGLNAYWQSSGHEPEHRRR